MIWIGQQLYPEHPLYSSPLCFYFNQEIDAGRFSRAFEHVLRESDALRTTFSLESEEPKQQLNEFADYQLKRLDWTAEKYPQSKLETWLGDRVEVPLDVTNCCFDTVLIQLSPQQWVWYFNPHHLVMDAWGVSVIYQRLEVLYKELANQQEVNSDPLPLFQDFLREERQMVDDTASNAKQTFWREQVERLSEPPSLFGLPSGGHQTASERLPIDLDQEQQDKLTDWCSDPRFRHWTTDLSRFNFFATLLLAYLYRVSGQSKLAILTPAHNRPTAKLRNTPGQFIELLPLSVELRDGMTFAELHSAVRNNFNAFLKHAQAGVTQAELVRAGKVVFNYINTKYNSFNDQPLRVEWLHPGHHDPGHPLRLQVFDFSGEGVRLELDLNKAYFPAALREQIPLQLESLLDTFLPNPDQPIATAVLGDPKLNGRIDGPEVEYPTESVLALLSKQEQQQADAIALSLGDQQLTYGEFAAATNQLARFLQERGVLAGDRVAIYHRRHPNLLIAIWAVLKAGATYVPIAADSPYERAKKIISSSQARLLLTEAQLNETLGELALTRIELDTDAAMIGQQSTEQLQLEFDPATPAYLLYTSGSTGEPKGVVISRAALANYVQWAGQTYLPRPKAVFPFFTTVGFDLTVTSLFVPLCHGGELRIYEEPLPGLPDLSLFSVLGENRVEVIKLTPSHLALVKGKDLRKCKIKTMIVGGENFSLELAQAVSDQLPAEVAIYNEYGPTEATVGCIVHRFDRQRDLGASVPIGRPIANMGAYVLDRGGNPLPVGVDGELYLSGRGLAQGYWALAQETAERFVDNPWQTGQKLYRTGDVVRQQLDGSLAFLGREDRQVKLRGFRIELNEVEASLEEQAELNQVAVELLDGRADGFALADHYCTNCGLPSNYPSAEFDEEGVCQLCRGFAEYEAKTRDYFRNMEDLRALLHGPAPETKGDYDCMMLLSGGKDSTYALGQLVELGLKVLAFTLDNGYISEQALANVKRVTEELGVDCVVGSTPAMDAIFVDSLQRHCNVCNGCFKTIYTLSTQIALEKNIPFIVTGLSRGQFFETRLTEELFWEGKAAGKDIDAVILEARKLYHRADDAVQQHLDVSMFETDEVFEKVQFVDFYRYCDATLDEMLTYLDQRLPWARPTDTGRSTNCLINQVGIYVHKQEKGYNNYAFPYSWDVRIGHKEREAALEEINEEVDKQEVKRIMEEIGYTEPTAEERQQLVAFYTTGQSTSVQKLRDYLAKRLPAYMIPTHFVEVADMPLTANGKINRKALREMKMVNSPEAASYIAPSTDIEEMLAGIWQEVLSLDKISVEDKFLDLGGHSLTAIRLSARISETLELEIPLTVVFDHPTIAAQATYIESLLRQLLEEMDS